MIHDYTPAEVTLYRAAAGSEDLLIFFAGTGDSLVIEGALSNDPVAPDRRDTSSTMAPSGCPTSSKPSSPTRRRRTSCLSSATVQEGAAGGTVIGSLSAVDADPRETASLHALPSETLGRFQIVGDELRVADGSLLDFDTAQTERRRRRGDRRGRA